MQATQPIRPAVQPYRAPFSPGLNAIAQSKTANVGQTTFIIGCVYTFFLFSRASEFIDDHGRLHLVLLLGCSGTLAVILSGSIPRLVKAKPGWWLSAFTAWLTIALPFSSWRASSFSSFSSTWLKSYLSFFIICGLINSLKHLRTYVFWIAVASLSVVYYAHRGGIMDSERLTLTYGTLGNSNDLASLLLMGLPFVLYVLNDKSRNLFVRLPFIGIALLMLGVVLKTGSRGGLVTISFLCLVAFVKSSPANKLKLLIVAAIFAVAFPFLVSRSLLERYKTIFASSDLDANASNNVNSAIESSNARRELMKNGIELMVRHPVFGVGIGQFGTASGALMIAKGMPPLWFTSHDVFLLIGGESGFPGLISYLVLIGVCFKILLRIQKQAKQDPAALGEYGKIAFTIMISLAAFVVSAVFSTNAYTFQMPALAGLTAAVEYLANPVILASQEARARRFKQQIDAVTASFGNPKFRPAPALQQS